MKIICWLVVPVVMVCLLVADALGVYTFTGENLVVLGACLCVVLLPFFSEIKVKDLAVKTRRSEGDKGT